ncbi:MAG: phage protease [Bacteroidia bacterium]
MWGFFVGEPMSDKPSRITFLNRLYSALQAHLSSAGFLSAEEFATVFKSARGHAGGKAKAEARLLIPPVAEVAAQAREQLLAAEAAPTGCIVCLVPDAETAQALAVDGGLTPEQIHLTLCHFGDLEILDAVQRAEALLAVHGEAMGRAPLTGEISGIGRFTNGDLDVIYASLDAPELNALRDCIVACLEMAGLDVSDEHGFTPHFTLTYIDRDMASPIEIIEPRPVVFDAVQVWCGPEHITIPLLGIDEMDGGDGEGMAAELPDVLQQALGANPDGTPIPNEQIAAEAGDLADLAATGHTHRLFNSIAFAEAPAWIPYLPKPGSYAHPRYGTITITTERNKRFVSNFSAGVYQDRLPIDAEHETKLSGAVGWITQMRQNSDGSADAKVDWTDRGQTFFAGDRFRYFSPEWYDAWEDPATRTQHKDVAIGGALTTRPFFKDPALRPLFASEGSITIDDEPQSQGDDMDAVQFAELETKVKDLESKLAARETENATLKTASEAAQAQSTALTEEVRRIASERQAERFTALIKNDGSRWFGEQPQHLSVLGVLAQTYGEDSAEFKAYIAQQQGIAAALRTSAAFNETGGDGGGRSEGASEKLDRLARERAAKDSIDYGDALAKVANENPDLYEQHSSAAYVRTKGAE